MVQWAKALDAKTEDLNSVPRTQTELTPSSKLSSVCALDTSVTPLKKQAKKILQSGTLCSL